MLKRAVVIQILLLAATFLTLFFGVRWALDAAPLASETRRQEMLDLLAAEVGHSTSRLAAVIEALRTPGSPPSTLEAPLATILATAQRASVRYRPEQLPPGLGEVFASAEYLEFVSKDPAAALRKYRQLLEGSLTPTEQVMAGRNIARLSFALKKHADGRAALREALSLSAAADSQRLLAAYELALDSPEARDALLRDIEESGYGGASPARRATIYRKLEGEDAARLLSLEAAALIFSAENLDDPVVLADRMLSWKVSSVGEWHELIAVPLEGLLQSLIPGWNAQRWALVGSGSTPNDAGDEGDGISLEPPFPPVQIVIGAASLDELDSLERTAFWRRFTAALVPAVFLVLAAGFLLLTELRQARLERRKRHFLWSITHEFKTPLANILLFAETIHTHAEKDPNQTRQFARTIGAEGRRLLHMVQQALDVAAGKKNVLPAKESLDLCALIGDVATEVRDAAAHRRIHLSVVLPEHSVTIQATHDLVMRALHGVADNAMKFARQEVHITLACHQSGTLTVTIEDDGPGIPHADLERVFEPFVRLGDVETRDAVGTGLGLTFVRQCVESDGGTVTAARSPRGGALLCIEYRNQHP